MALLAFEGFDYFNTSTDFMTKSAWTSSSTAALAGSKITGFGGVGGAMRMNNQSNRALGVNTGATATTLISGIYYRTAGLALVPILTFFDNAAAQCGVCLTAAGHLAFFRGTTATIVATGASTLSTNTWYCIELKVTFGNAGSYEIRLDGVSELSNGSVDTTNTANNYGQIVQLPWGIVAISVDIDNFYACDDTGGVANNFLNPYRVETLFVTSDDSVAFTPLSSTNASNVDETLMDSSTSYNYSYTTGNVDLFNHDSLSLTPSTIYGVDVVVAMIKDDVTAQTIRTKLKSGTTTQNGSSTTSITTSAYKYFEDMYTTDPNTGSAWTSTAVNNSKIGYEHV